MAELELETPLEQRHLLLNGKETKALERIFLHEYINYEDTEAHAVLHKIMEFNHGKTTRFK